MAALTRCVVARVAGAHGLHGTLKLRWLGDSAENLLACSELWLARREDDPQPTHFEVRRKSGGVVGDVRIELEGLEDRDAALGWKGAWVSIALDELAELPAGEHYWHELIGCQVVSRDGTAIGEVREIWATGAHDVLVVQPPQARGEKPREPVLIPTADEFVKQIDLAARRIVVALIPGLLDD